MNESEKLYLNRKADQMKAIIESDSYPVEQKFIGFHAICEDLILLKLEAAPNITRAVQNLFTQDEEIINDMNECAKKIQAIIDKNEAMQDLQAQLKELGDERLSLIKKFYREYRKHIEPKEVETKKISEEITKTEDKKDVAQEIDEIINPKE